MSFFPFSLDTIDLRTTNILLLRGMLTHNHMSWDLRQLDCSLSHAQFIIRIMYFDNA